MVAPSYTKGGLLFSLALMLAPVVTKADGRTPSPRRYGTYLDALPPPGSEEHQGFITRVLKWHSTYCGRDRLCVDQMSSLCFRCAPCACDTNCHNYKDCCPDLTLEPQETDFSRPTVIMNVISCESAQFYSPVFGLKKSKVTKLPGDGSRILVGHVAQSNIGSYYMVSRCPLTGPIGEKCEKGDLAPVTSTVNSSNVVFRNIHCAWCHGAVDDIPWMIMVMCEERRKLTSFPTITDLMKTLIPAGDCEFVFVPPPDTEARKCHVTKDMISKCNVTGMWMKRDSFYERACHSYLTPKRIDGTLYRNVFCYLCNHEENANVLQMKLGECQMNPLGTNTSLSFTLRHSDLTLAPLESNLIVDKSLTLCGTSGIFDFQQEVCREVSCAQGQQLTSGTCRPLFSSATDLVFEIYFGLRPLQTIDLSGADDLRHHLPTEMETYLSQTLLRGNFKLQYFAMAFNTTDHEGRCGQLSRDLGVYALMLSKSVVDQKKVQEEFLRLRLINFTLTHGSWNLSFQAFPSETPRTIMHPSSGLLPVTSPACVIVVSNDQWQKKKDGVSISRVGSSTPDTSISLLSDNIIRISSLLECPHIQLFPNEFTLSGQDGTIGLHWGHLESVVYRQRYTIDLDGNVSICLEDFLPKLTRDTGQRTGTENIVVSVLLPISLFSLFACFTVFVAFTELRSLSGKNNMLLTACLFLSQGTLLLGYIVDDVSVSCVALGLLTHYFCLCLLCALVVCSYSVYAMFATMHLSANVNREWKSLVLHCCVTFIAPAPVVMLVVVVHVATHLPATVVGYGGGAICILSKMVAVWVVLFIPVVLCLIITSLFFVLACTSLRHNKDVEVNAAEERHVQFYFRTSLMTTVTWAVGVVGIVTSLPWLRITFIVFQSILGMYVFVTLVLTERVTRLLTGCCCGSRRPPRGRTSLNLKMASRSECPARNPCIVATKFRKTESVLAECELPDKVSQRSFDDGMTRGVDKVISEGIDTLETVT